MEQYLYLAVVLFFAFSCKNSGVYENGYITYAPVKLTIEEKEIIAEHYHQPTAQWAGPHSRSYSTPVSASFHGILYQASDGKIDLGVQSKRSDVKVKHQIPGSLLPSNENAPVDFTLDGLQFHLQLFYGVFGKYKGRWEKGGDETHAWLDYVIYSGNEKEIDLTTTDVAAFGYTFGVASEGEKIPEDKVTYAVKQGLLNTNWNGLNVSVSIKPDKKPGHL